MVKVVYIMLFSIGSILGLESKYPCWCLFVPSFVLCISVHFFFRLYSLGEQMMQPGQDLSY